jgi:hypothetical protein
MDKSCMKMKYERINRSISRKQWKLKKFLTSRLKIELNKERNKQKKNRILIRKFWIKPNLNCKSRNRKRRRRRIRCSAIR